MAEIEELLPVDQDDDGYSREGDQWVKTIDLGDGSRPSVFKGGTKKEVAQKIEESFRTAARRVRQQELQLKLGGGLTKPDPLVDLPEFKPRQLTQEERSQVAQKILDPQRSNEAVRITLEAELGAPISQIREVLQNSTQSTYRQKCIAVGEAFLRKHPDFSACAENDKNMNAYLLKNKMAYTLNNLEIAFEDLQSLWILESPKAETDVNPKDEPVSNPPASQPVSHPRSASVPLDDRSSSVPKGTRPTATITGPSYEDCERMSAAEFERWSSNPTNAAYYERLVAARNGRR